VPIPNNLTIVHWFCHPHYLPKHTHNSLPAPLKATARGFIITILYTYMKSINHFPHLHLLHLPPPLTSTPSHTLYLSTVLSMFKGIPQSIPALSVLYVVQFNPFHYSPLPLPSHYPLFNRFQYIIVTSSTCTDVIYFNIVDTLSFSFNFPPPRNSVQ
jgi:hypothetical protein